MKLYMHPVSMTSRPVRLFIAENKIPCEEKIVDLFTGEHYKEPYTSINPNRLVPVLEDGDFRLTESSAILKYLADSINSPTYPKDLKKRAKVNEIMDWFNSNFYRDWAYGLIYPQVFPHHKRPNDAIQQGTLAWAKERVAFWLQVLNDHWIGKKKYLTGDDITIADYFCIALLTLGESIGVNFKQYPNVDRWMGTMKQLKNWKQINEVFYGFVESNKGKQFVSI